jgi:uncharacterized protein (DUF1778 family)
MSSEKRIEIRTTEKQKQLFKQAAEVIGQTLSAFIKLAAHKEANRILKNK